MSLISLAVTLCCTSQLILQVICQTNRDKVYTLGFVLCNLGGKLRLKDCVQFDIIQFWISEIINSCPIAKGQQ